MTRRVGLGAFIMLAAAAALAPLAAQPAQQLPIFRAEVEYVEVDVSVTDGQGQFVRDLTKDDFRVVEDGKPQNVAGFTLVDIPIAREDRPLYSNDPIEPDVRSNERPFDGRLYVMVIDDLHTAASRTERARAAGRQFIERHLGANDLMAVVHTDGRVNAAQEFTGNKRLLLAAAEKTSGRKLRSATLNKVDDDRWKKSINRAEPPVDQDDAQRAYNAQSTLRVLRNVVDRLAAVHGRRKTLLLISEGIDYDVEDVMNFKPTNSNHNAVQDVLADTREALAAASRSNVLIYAVDPRGLDNSGSDDILLSAVPQDQTLGLNAGTLRDEVRLAQNSLHALSGETGGFAVINSNDLSIGYRRLVADNSSYYLLAYYPEPTRRDGRFHSITVSVGRPGVNVRARRGYMAPRDKAPVPAPPDALKAASAELRDALASVLPVSGLHMRVSVAAFKGTAPNASVLVLTEMPGGELKASAGDKLELSYLAFDAEGQVRGGGTVQVPISNLRPEVRTRLEQTGLRALNRMELPPGRYQIRVAARNSAGGAVGSVPVDLEVPEFHKLPFGMSSLVLTSMSGSAMVTTKADAALNTVLPAPPIAERIFLQNDELALFAEVYDDGAAAPHKVDILTTVRSDDGTVFFKTQEERASSDLRGGRGAYGYAARVPLGELKPGSYILSVEARSRLGVDTVAGRQVRVTVAAAQRTQAR